jgi:tocopherol O-methyltransferase
VLDAGCGVGGSSIWLAKHIGCKSVGISLSRKQVYQGKEIALKEKVDHLVTFLQKDYTATGFENETFDVVWAIESVCYVPDKSAFIKEAFRILKKGGRLVVADFFKKDDLQENDSEEVKRWANGWAIEDYITKEHFESLLANEGFSNIGIKNVTGSIMRSARRLYAAYFIGMIPAFLYRLFHSNATDLAKNNVNTAYLQYKTLKKGLWQYGIVAANKI